MSQYPPFEAERAGARLAGAPVCNVVPESPADDAGFGPGCFIVAVDGQPVRDIIDWRWLSADDAISVTYIDADGDAGTIDLERYPGEDWGFEFSGVVFDEIKQCRNACTFCFMRQLPRGMRASLSLRDDDYRLSFLSGTFVTLTNISPEDEQRIVEQRISPLRVSLQASNAAVREKLIGKHAVHGLAVLDRLLEAGIQFHAQVVLVPGQNDGAALDETLAWAYERPGIRALGIVPLGFTRHQNMFSRSFDQQDAALGVLDQIEPIQQRARAERGHAWVYAADEFYCNAYGNHVIEHLMPSEDYGAYEMFEDGIGIVRAYVDEWREAQRCGLTDACAEALRASGLRARYVAGRAMQPYFDTLVESAGIGDCFVPLYVDNEYFGGNVTVTGLLCGEDIAHALKTCAQSGEKVFLPDVVLNGDGLFLDGMCVRDVEQESGESFNVVSCSPIEYLRQIADIVQSR